MLSYNVRDLCFSCYTISFGLDFLSIDAAVDIDEYIFLYHVYTLVNVTQLIRSNQMRWYFAARAFYLISTNLPFGRGPSS